MSLERFKIEVPTTSHHKDSAQQQGPTEFIIRRDVLEKWCRQSEAVNALLDSAGPNGIFLNKEHGYFIPMPEPDSMEKLLKDFLSEFSVRGFTSHEDNIIQHYIGRAQKLLEEKS